MRFIDRTVLWALLAVAGSISVASADKSAARQRTKPTEAPPAAAAPPADGMQIAGLGGELDAALVEKLLLEHQPVLRRCYSDVAERLHYLGGRLALKVIVLPSGQPKTITITDSNIGNLEVERCIVGSIDKLKFPPPKGGDGELTYPFECSGKTPVGSWPGPRIASSLEKKKSALKGCKGRAGSAPVGALRATLYIGPGGKATSVGFAADSPLDDKLTSCAAKALLSAQYDDPLGQMVKVDYNLSELFPR